MRSIPILMPQLGESIAEATVRAKVLIAPGAKVEAEQDVFEVETNKATMSIIAPASGTVGTVNAQIGTSYAVGAALASLQISEADARALGLNEAPPEAPPRMNRTKWRPRMSSILPSMRRIPLIASSRRWSPWSVACPCLRVRRARATSARA